MLTGQSFLSRDIELCVSVQRLRAAGVPEGFMFMLGGDRAVLEWASSSAKDSDEGCAEDA